MLERLDTEYVNIDVRQYQELAGEILSVVREPLAWMKFIPDRKLKGWGKVEFKWYQQLDVPESKVTMDADEVEYGSGYLSPTTQKIPTFSQDIRISQRNLETSRMEGLESLDLRAQKNKAAKLIEDLEEAIGKGITRPVDVNPFNQDIQDAGGGLDWATVANIVTDTNTNYTALLADKFYGPYKTLHYATLAGALKQLVGNTASTYEDYVNRIATLGTSYTLQTAIAAGTAASGTDATQTMIEPITMGQNNFELLIAQEWTSIDLTSMHGGWGLTMKLYGAYIHEIYRSNAGAVIDGITDLAN